MATFNSASKSSRLLQSKRYTILPSDFQEAYTSVLDLNASEIYTQEGGIPTSSLPYSGSSQDGNLIVSGSTNIAQYYYRLELSPSDTITDGKYLTWFAISSSANEIGYYSASSAQVIQANQATSWISNKYAEPSLAGNKADVEGLDGTPGYNISLLKGSSKVDVAQVDDADYQYDYKTGVVQWINTTAAPNAQASAGSNRLYLSGYQYIGQTLDEFISTGGSGGDGTPGGDNTQIQFNDSDSFGGDPRLIFQKSTGLTQLSGSFQITGSDDNIFLIKSGSVDLLRMSSSGALIFGDLQHTPSPVVGGLFYSSSNFYVGIE
jgi:hypothetical protein